MSVIQFKQDHVSDEIASCYVRGAAVPTWVSKHLKSHCNDCSNRLYARFDEVCEQIEGGKIDMDADELTIQLADRLPKRQFCPMDLVELLLAKDLRAQRHVRFCALCRSEAMDIQQAADDPAVRLVEES